MKQKTKKNLKRNTYGLLFVSPLIVYFLVFQLAPMVLAFIISFTNYSGGLEETKWVGLQNYIDLLTNKGNLYGYFGKSLLVSFEYILLTVPLNIILALVVSALLNSKIKGEKFFKTAFYVPSVTASMALTALWKYMLDSGDNGLVNGLLGTNINFWGTAGLNLVMLAVMSVWGGLGYNVLIMLTAMKNIDQSLYEAASIDGASSFKQFWNITVPGVMPTVFFFLITGIIGGFQVFEQMLLITGRGPQDSTYTFVYAVYQNAIIGNEYGLGSAMSFILFLLILALTVIQFRSLPKDTPSGAKKRRAKR